MSPAPAERPRAASGADPADFDGPLRHYLLSFFPDFQFRPQDRFFFAALLDEFPGADLLAELRTFHAWCLDRQGPRPMNYRLTFRKWVSNAQSRKPPPPAEP